MPCRSVQLASMIFFRTALSLRCVANQMLGEWYWRARRCKGATDLPNSLQIGLAPFVCLECALAGKTFCCSVDFGERNSSRPRQVHMRFEHVMCVNFSMMPLALAAPCRLYALNRRTTRSVWHVPSKHGVSWRGPLRMPAELAVLGVRCHFRKPLLHSR